MGEVDLIKIDHHGLKIFLNSNFIKKINPKYVVITVGSNNKYGHPDRGTMETLVYENLEVHHAIPISKSEELKLDDNNLITLCSFHHSMCEKGKIPFEEVQGIINNQNQFTK